MRQVIHRALQDIFSGAIVSLAFEPILVSQKSIQTAQAVDARCAVKLADGEQVATAAIRSRDGVKTILHEQLSRGATGRGSMAK